MSERQFIDCFNGDADGICALVQLRLQQPVESLLITGVKRDIQLLQRVAAEAGDHVTALDISLDKNRAALIETLQVGATVFYCDHHYPGETLEHPNLTAVINTAANVCTSLLINQRSGGEFAEWAVVGTFGDNLDKSARGLAKSLDLSHDDLEVLRNLGIYMNYNGYGASLEDLYFDPTELFRRVVRYPTAREFLAQDQETFSTLENGYHQDMSKASKAEVVFGNRSVSVFVLPNEAWARRVSGVYGNQLANQHPDRAHAVLTEKSAGDFLVSVRAPLNRKTGADEICRQFATGGGRAAAAGINSLPASDLDRFIQTLDEYYR